MMSPLHRQVLLREAWKAFSLSFSLALSELLPYPRTPRLDDDLEWDSDATQEESESPLDTILNTANMHKPIKPLMAPPARRTPKSPNPTEHEPSPKETKREVVRRKTERKDLKGHDEDFIMNLEKGFYPCVGPSSYASSKDTTQPGSIDDDIDEDTTGDPKTYEELLNSDTRIWMWCGSDSDGSIRAVFDKEFDQQPLVNPVEDTNPESFDELHMQNFIRIVFISRFFRDGVHYAMYVVGKYNSSKMMSACYSGSPYDGPFFATPIILHTFDEVIPLRSANSFEEILRSETKGLRFKYYYDTCIRTWERLDYDAEKAAALSERYPSSPIDEEIDEEMEEQIVDTVEGKDEDKVDTPLDSPTSPQEKNEDTEDMSDYEKEDGEDADVSMDEGDDDSEETT